MNTSFTVESLGGATTFAVSDGIATIARQDQPICQIPVDDLLRFSAHMEQRKAPAADAIKSVIIDIARGYACNLPDRPGALTEIGADLCQAIDFAEKYMGQKDSTT
jgi:hypothetical protein